MSVSPAVQLCTRVLVLIIRHLAGRETSFADGRHSPPSVILVIIIIIFLFFFLYSFFILLLKNCFIIVVLRWRDRRPTCRRRRRRTVAGGFDDGHRRHREYSLTPLVVLDFRFRRVLFPPEISRSSGFRVNFRHRLLHRRGLLFYFIFFMSSLFAKKPSIFKKNVVVVYEKSSWTLDSDFSTGYLARSSDSLA